MDAGDKEKALQLAKSASVDLLDDARPLHEILDVCRNICKMAGISDGGAWLDLEASGYLVKYKTRDDLYQNLPPYRRTSWRFYDLYGNQVNLPPDIVDLFGRSTVYHPVRDLEGSDQVVIEGRFLESFNKFIAAHGMDQFSKSLKIHEARLSKDEVRQVCEGVKKRIQELLDMVISLLE